MILDNEEQRKLLIQIINSTNLNGNFTQVKDAVRLIDKLVNDINTATIKEQAEEIKNAEINS